MRKNISTLVLINSLVIAVIFTTVMLLNFNQFYKEFRSANDAELKSFYISQQKEHIQQEVNRFIKRVNLAKSIATEDAKIHLKERVVYAESFAMQLFQKNQKADNDQFLGSMINSFKWDENSGYFFVVSKDGTIIHHGGEQIHNGRKIQSLKNEFPDMVNFIEKVFDKKEAYGTYDYYFPGDSSRKYPKLTYAKYNPTLGILIATGVYQKNIDHQVQEQVLKNIANERFGYNDYGYFWILNSNGNIVFHIDPKLYNINTLPIQDSKGKYLFKDFVDIAKTAGSGFSEYYWNIPGETTSSRKISYVHYIKDWDWIVGTGFYFENLSGQVEKEERLSQSILKDSLREYALVILILLAGVIIVSLYLYKRIRAVEISQEIYTNDLLQYKTVINESSLVTITDTTGVISHVNDQLCELTGFPREKFIGNRHSIIGHPDNPRSVYDDLWRTIRNEKVWKGILKNITADGGYFYQKTTIVPFKNKESVVTKYMSISHDVTEVFENKTKLQQYLIKDTLTGLNNRNSLMAEIQDAKSADLAVIDIDGFHAVNDSYGMKTGDELLIHFSIRLKESNILNKYEIYRLHSDVFAVLSQRNDTAEFVNNVDKAIKQITKMPFTINGTDILIRTIAGFAHGSTNILAQADSALQFAKTSNIEHYIYDSSKLDKTAMYEKSTRIIKMLSSATEEDRVVPYFQPIVGVKDNVTKYECLMRIIDEDGTVISPAEFLDISKQTRFYPFLTRIIIKKSIDTFAETNAEFSINISYEDIQNTDSMEFLYSYAHEKGVLKRMIIEIVESESLASISSAIETLNKFKLAGAKIAIDDFGTGYSNFDYLLKIKADYIKIDGSIIKLITKDDRAKDIVKSIVSYAIKLRMKTVAEFISEKALADAAKEMGIDYLQGYYIGKPSPNITTGAEATNTGYTI